MWASQASALRARHETVRRAHPASQDIILGGGPEPARSWTILDSA